MNQYLIMTDFGNEFGDLTLIHAKDFTEAICIFKRERKKDKWIIKDSNRDPRDDWEELIDWQVVEQNSDYHEYIVEDVTVIIYKLPNGPYNLIARYGNHHRKEFSFFHKDDLI